MIILHNKLRLWAELLHKENQYCFLKHLLILHIVYTFKCVCIPRLALELVTLSPSSNIWLGSFVQLPYRIGLIEVFFSLFFNYYLKLN